MVKEEEEIVYGKATEAMAEEVETVTADETSAANVTE